MGGGERREGSLGEQSTHLFYSFTIIIVVMRLTHMRQRQCLGEIVTLRKT